ncbi:MAG: L-2-hydroxyglutarate oxidase [Salinibacter sp.]
MHRTDVAIIGGGIVGLATADQLTQHDPSLRVLVLEKEPDVAQHQTGRNSGVIHSGIYYTPGSLKARTCRAGKAALEAFCEAEEIPFDRCGKVIVATDASELPALDRIYENGQANGVDCETIGPERLREIEPHAQGIRAIHVPETGIVDYVAVSRRLAERVQARGGALWLNAAVHGLDQRDESVIVHSAAGAVEAQHVINCAGLYADRIARMTGTDPGVQIVPFRGEYYELIPEARRLCRGLIYPVPNPSFPFLGVHFTRMIDGGVECGPNAVLALAREGYRWSEIDGQELIETLAYSGFQKLAARYWRIGLGEMWRSASKKAFVGALQKLVPDIESRHLQAAPAGVRAQAVTPDGRLHDDFMIKETGAVISVCNAPSPAATSALSIGQTIVERLLPKLKMPA